MPRTPKSVGAMAKRKGSRAELEIVHMLSEAFPSLSFSRNLEQSRDGGGDVLGLPGYSIEVKHHSQPQLNKWWKQAEDQARRAGKLPLLVYKINRMPWMVMCLSSPAIYHGPEEGSKVRAGFADNLYPMLITWGTFVKILLEDPGYQREGGVTNPVTEG